MVQGKSGYLCLCTLILSCQVVSWGDIYYKLGCSTTDPMAEKSEMKVRKEGRLQRTYCESCYRGAPSHGSIPATPTTATAAATSPPSWPPSSWPSPSPSSARPGCVCFFVPCKCFSLCFLNSHLKYKELTIYDMDSFLLVKIIFVVSIHKYQVET